MGLGLVFKATAMVTVKVQIDAHEDGMHCGMCRGRWQNAERCDVFSVQIKNVNSYLLQAIRCRECREGEIESCKR